MFTVQMIGAIRREDSLISSSKFPLQGSKTVAEKSVLKSVKTVSKRTFHVKLTSRKLHLRTPRRNIVGKTTLMRDHAVTIVNSE